MKINCLNEIEFIAKPFPQQNSIFLYIITQPIFTAQYLLLDSISITFWVGLFPPATYTIQWCWWCTNTYLLYPCHMIISYYCSTAENWHFQITFTSDLLWLTIISSLLILCRLWLTKSELPLCCFGCSVHGVAYPRPVLYMWWPVTICPICYHIYFEVFIHNFTNCWTYYKKNFEQSVKTPLYWGKSLTIFNFIKNMLWCEANTCISKKPLLVGCSKENTV